MSKRRSFGEVVKIDGSDVAVIAKLNTVGDEFEMNSRPCQICNDADCKEFNNLLTEGGEWVYHVSECRMTDG